VGRPGRRAVRALAPRLIEKYSPQIVIANGENLAGGFGLTRETADELFSCGVDIITTGNHVWNKKEFMPVLSSEERILRPANYPPGVPGNGFIIWTAKGGSRVGVISLAGRVFMGNLDCPFRAAEQLVSEIAPCTRVIVVDFHAEATSEKSALAWFLDGKVSCVAGTHTHVQTSDERILPGGTAYITDLGMTGPIDSVIGMKKEPVIEKFLTQRPIRFEVATGRVVLSGAFVDVDDETGKAISIERIYEEFSG